FRLDAIPYLYEREGTTCENLPETHEFLKKIRRHLDSKYENRMLLAEANQWPEDTRPYFGDGDECHMAFHFPVMPRLYMALAMEDHFPIVDIMAQTPPIPENCQWALFLRNHDELTLEMVTEEDRDYMWRTYAADRQARINLGIRRRLAPLMGNHRGRIHVMNGLLFSMPGTPIIYYGDEIGMGDNIYLGDRNGVRTPMQWSADRNAGFSRANPQKLYLPVIIDPQYHYEQVNVESQQNSPYSLLWWMKRLIAIRKRYRAFGRGTMEFIHTDNRKVVAYVRRYEDEIILVVANLSRLVQCFDLDLAQFRGMVPVELSGGTRFPEVGERPYFLNLGPFAFYWFALAKQSTEALTLTTDAPTISARNWSEVFAGRNRDALAAAILRYLRSRRWFAGKARTVTSLTLRDRIPMSRASIWLALVEVEYADGTPETYLLPLAMRPGMRRGDDEMRAMLIARLRDNCVLYEPVGDEAFTSALLDVIGRRKNLKGERGVVSGDPTPSFKSLRGDGPLEAQVLKTEQSNTAIVYGQRLFLKLFRKLERGVNTDLEMTTFLNEETSFRSAPRVAGSLQYETAANEEPAVLAILQGYTENSGDAWTYTLDAIGRYFERFLSDSAAERVAKSFPAEPAFALAQKPSSELAQELIGAYLSDASLLGKRTAEMHLALASRDDIPSFAPEPFTPHYQRSIYQLVRQQAVQTLQLIRRKAKDQPEAKELLERESDLQKRIRQILDRRITGFRIRTHGDYHLGQVLRSGNDFVIIDFEGEPSRPLGERRIKRSALRDIAGMLRSFHYAPHAVVFGQAAPIREEDAAKLENGIRFWHRWVGAAFLRTYLAESAGGRHLPGSLEEAEVLLDSYLIEKALYEIGYELNNRPDWVRIPLRGVLDLIK
ncbi:MAG: putative maltokinase, partial [Thermoanaerobaculia bacterium]